MLRLLKIKWMLCYAFDESIRFTRTALHLFLFIDSLLLLGTAFQPLILSRTRSIPQFVFLATGARLWIDHCFLSIRMLRVFAGHGSKHGNELTTVLLLTHSPR